MNQKEEEKTIKKKSVVREYVESLLVALAIAIVIRALVIYPFRIPTSSMEDSLLVGDFLLANKFAYGVRSPDWIGIPYTRIGFYLPFFRTPGFRKPQSGDVVIFKYPRDPYLNYIKRCIATSGDTIEIRDKVVTVNGREFPNPPHFKHIDRTVRPEGYSEREIYPPDAGNRDNYGPVRIPAPGDTFHFTHTNRSSWFERLQIALYEGHKITLSNKRKSIPLNMENLNSWHNMIKKYPIDYFYIDGKPIGELIYTVKNRHYFMMGDNRDNSLDSRYWGFLPERYVVGEALIIYWSWDNRLPIYRFLKKIRWQRVLKIIH